MGGCLSGDVRGGQQAIGVGGIHDKTACGNNAACNEAVDFFFRSRGQLPLFSQIEVLNYPYSIYIYTYIYITYMYQCHSLRILQYSIKEII